MDMRAWHYFLTLERDCAATAAYVEPHAANHLAFSDRYAGLLLLIGSEVDVVAKAISRRLDGGAKAEKIDRYRDLITARYPRLHGIEVEIPRYDLRLRPWSEWGTAEPATPRWWRSYNKVKHDRLQNREHASQINVLEGLSGLFVLNLYLHEKPETLWPQPELLHSEFLPSLLIDAATFPLPDV